jgi:4-phospho-D-threonate 3-dehydrogenase / 4-phospho-D-erythronate 3-dehydrogenase
MAVPKIGFTLGDPGGVGPEIVFDAIKATINDGNYCPVVYGSSTLLESSLWEPLTSSLSINLCDSIDSVKLGVVNFVNVGIYNGEIEKRASSQNGQLSFESILRATKDAQSGAIDAIVTAPICKESFLLAGLNFTGHTTLLKSLTGSKNVSMGFFTEKLKTVLATVHIPLIDVPKAITKDCLDDAFENTLLFSRLLSIKSPKIAVAALNPHASEQGMFGHEEQTLLNPAIERWTKKGHSFIGPVPADTLYHRAYQGDFDLVVSLYHDQGLIPIKLLNFHDAVNVTLGLPFIRTSPDHGTAFDIAYQGKANSGSLKSALNLALTLIRSQCLIS